MPTSKFLFSCQHCNLTFESENKCNANKYCSRQCYWNSKQPRPTRVTQVIKKCITCKIDFGVLKSLSHLNNKYCSRACDPHFSGKRFTRKCEGCNNTFKVRPCHVKARFCGNACRMKWFSTCFFGKTSPNWKGGHPGSYGSSWGPAKRAAYAADDYACRECGLYEEDNFRRLDVHHIIPFRHFGVKRHEEANRLTNLITLCPTCHHRWERKPIEWQQKRANQ